MNKNSEAPETRDLLELRARYLEITDPSEIERTYDVRNHQTWFY